LIGCQQIETRESVSGVVRYSTAEKRRKTMVDLVALVKDYHEQERRSESGKLYPSSLGGCMRKEMIRWHNEQARRAEKEKPYPETHPMDTATRWKLARYGWYEAALINPVLAEYGEHGIFAQRRVEDEHWSGKIDLAFFTNKGHHLVEIKTISPYAAKHGNLPYNPHKLQLWAYCLLEKDPVYKATLFYITRWWESKHDGPELYQFDVTPTEQDLNDVADEMEMYEHWTKQDTLPEVPFDSPEEHAYLCTGTVKKQREIRCPYFGLCYPDNVDWQGNYVPSDDGDEYLPF